MADIDSYLVPRMAITPNVDMQHVQEVGGFCPLCGKSLLENKGKRVNKKYEIAHIYPNSPTEHQKEELKDLERLGRTCEDFENKIALCKDCHDGYDNHTTKEEYLKLVAIKKQLLKENITQIKIATQDIESELLTIIEQMSVVDNDELSQISLKYKGIKIADKLEDKYLLLRRKIEFNVCTYYGFIKESMKNLVDVNKLNFDLVAAEIRTAYLKAASESVDDKVLVFNALVKWLNSKIPQASEEGCEIMISFFVQNCEVFDEISK